MKSQDKKNIILDATIDLLQKSKNIDDVTVRDIVKRADVNLSTVNYYFGTKDKLMMDAVSRIMEIASLEPVAKTQNGSSPREILQTFLLRMNSIVVDYEKYTKPTIPRLLLNDNITIPDIILPMVRACIPDKDESYCRLISYELIVFLQVAFYRTEEFRKYCGFDLNDEHDREKLLMLQLDMMLKE